VASEASCFFSARNLRRRIRPGPRRPAAQAGEQAEQTFLSPLSADEAQQFRKTLRGLLYHPPAGPR
jgi:hypothetical protein